MKNGCRTRSAIHSGPGRGAIKTVSKLKVCTWRRQQKRCTTLNPAQVLDS